MSTGFVDIKLALRTADLRRGVILSRKLSAESDTVMNQAAQNLISDDEARAWLALVIDRERDKIATLNLVRRTDSLDPMDDQRHDRAMQAAWAHIAANGIHAPPSPGADTLTASNVELLRADLTSAVRRRIISSGFKACVGRNPGSALETLALLDIYVQGKSEAWAHPMPQAALTRDIIAAPIPQLVESALPKDPQPAESPVLADPEPCALDPDLSAVVERMNPPKRAEGVEEKPCVSITASSACSPR